MTDDKPAWIVMVTNLYLCGLGETFKSNPKETGYVFNRRPESALRFTSKESAKEVADRFGGQVFKV